MNTIDYVRFLSGNWQIDIDKTIEKYGDLLTDSFNDNSIKGAVKCPDHDSKFGNLIYDNLFSDDYDKPPEPKNPDKITAEEEEEKNNYQNRSKCFHSVCKEKINEFLINNNYELDERADTNAWYNPNPFNFFSNRKTKSELKNDNNYPKKCEEAIPSRSPVAGIGKPTKAIHYNGFNYSNSKPIHGNGKNRLYSSFFNNNYGSPNAINWLIDFSEAYFKIGFAGPDKGVIDINANKPEPVLMVKLNIYHIESEDDKNIYFKMQKGSDTETAVFNVDSGPTRSKDPHVMSDIIKIIIDIDNNIIMMEGSTLYPNMALKRIIPNLGAPFPVLDSLDRLYYLLESIGKLLFKKYKIEKGIKFKVVENKIHLNEIKRSVDGELNTYYDELINFLPQDPKSIIDERQYHKQTPTDSPTPTNITPTPTDTPTPNSTYTPVPTTPGPTFNYEDSTYDQIIESKITKWLKENFNENYSDKSDKIDSEIYRAFKDDPKNGHYSKTNFIQDIVENLFNNENNLHDLCKKRELGTIEPNKFLKDTAIAVSGLGAFFDTVRDDVPRIDTDLSNKFYTYQVNATESQIGTKLYCKGRSITNNPVINHINMENDLLNEPVESEAKYCDSDNFVNKKEILNTCNTENMFVLEQLCNEYGVNKSSQGGYPETQCKISHLNKLLVECDKRNITESECITNPSISGCNTTGFESSSDSHNVKKSLIKTFPNEIWGSFYNGGCSAFTKYYDQIEAIEKQDEINDIELEEHLKKSEEILAIADTLNMTHKLNKNEHENIINMLEKRNEKLNKGRLCNSLKRVYDYNNDKCTNKYLTSINIEKEADITMCYDNNKKHKIKSYVKIGSNIFMFFIYLMIIIYFAILRK